MKKIIISLVITLFMCATAAAQKQHKHAEDEKCEATIHGHVIDATTGTHAPFITIAVEGTTIGTTTDATGHYTLYHAPVGKFKMTASAVGYTEHTREIEVECGADIQVNFEISESQISLDAVVVSANRNASTRREAPALVNIIDARLFESVSAPTIAEGLSFQSGVRVENSCQNCGFAQVRINGLDGQYSQILINSRPIFSALAGVYGLEHIPSNMVERIEVVRGGGSALYGSSAIGGTINIITKEPSHNTGELTHTITSTGCSSAFDNNTTLNASLVTDNNKAGMYVYGQSRIRDAYDHDGDGFVEIPVLKSQTVGTRAYVKTSNYNTLTLDYHVTNEHRRGGDRLDQPPHEALIAETTDHLINSGGLSFDGTSTNSKHRYSIYTSAQSTRRSSYYGANCDPHAYGKTDGTTAVIGGQYLFRLKKFELTSGLEYNYDYLYDNPIGYVSLGYASMRTEQHIHTASALLQGEFKFNKWGFLVGGRLDNWNNGSKNLLIPSPRITFRYNPHHNVNLRAVYSSGFRAPQAFDEDLHILVVGGERTRIRLADDLKEERSHTFSLSADMYKSFGRVETNLLVEGFYTMLNDVFALRSTGYIDPNDNATMHERYNGSGATVMGINLEAKVAYAPYIQAQVGVTLQRSRYTSPEEWSEDKSLATKNMFRSPNSYGYITLSSSPVRNFKIDLSANYTGRMYMQHFAGGILPDGSTLENDEIVKTDPFFDLGLKLAYDFKIHRTITLQINGGVKNILNSYQRDFDRGANRDSGYIYGPSLPRSWFVGAKLSF